MREEQEIFDDLAKICASPGYAHAIAYLCFRDNMVGYEGEMTAEDMQHLFSMDRLVRTEISALIGLLFKGKINYSLPTPVVMQNYLEKTEALLQEMHNSMSAKLAENPLTSGAALREPIFYGGESAYTFQYRDLAIKKYANDDAWLITNKGFSIQQASNVVRAVCEIQNRKTASTLKALKKAPPEQWTMLPAFTFSAPEVADQSGCDIADVERVLLAFSLPPSENNSGFRAINDFNAANASPLLRLNSDEFILFQTYNLVEALYEVPFYWMGADKTYVNDAVRHRGRFTEEFSRKRLELVFGQDKVYSNVDIVGAKGRKAGEIDVLVVFANRAIVLQAKSKRLTLEARKGHDGRIKDDFKKSIQDSHDQGYKCAKLLSDSIYKLVTADSREVQIPVPLKEIYIFCVVADHYPALAFQARQFLRFEQTETIQPPFVMDIFLLDAMTEMLQSPLHFLSYTNRRTNYSDRLLASHELTILSYHLKNNLWFDDEHDMVMLSDDISSDLDVAMAVRRDGIPGKPTPDGILTRSAATSIGKIVREIEARPDPGTIDLGFLLLTLSEDTVNDVSNGIDHIAKQARMDRKHHDLTVGIAAGTGLTIHCNSDPIDISGPRLQGHCEMRKYTEKARTWFGVCVLPEEASLRFGLCLDYKWERSGRMDELTKHLRVGERPAKIVAAAAKNRKVGRNDPCPCESGKKYKKCCLAQ